MTVATWARDIPMALVDSSNQKYTTGNYDCNGVEVRARHILRLKSKHARYVCGNGERSGWARKRERNSE